MKEIIHQPVRILSPDRFAKTNSHILKGAKGIISSLLLLISTLAVSQNVQVNFASNRDSVGTEGDIVRVPILLDTVYTNDMVGENIIALNLEFSHSADLTPQSFDFTGSLIETWSINTTISGTNRFKITAAGVNPIALDSGLLFYVDYLLNDVTAQRNPTFTLYTSTGADNYFNEGGYDFTMDYGQIQINPILELNAGSSPNRITVGDSTRVSASGGTAPYTYSLADPTFGAIVSDEYFLADRHGFAVVNVEDSNGLQGSTTVEVRAFELDMKAPEEEVLPGGIEKVYVTTTDLSDLNIISGEFKFNGGNSTNVEFIDAETSGFLLDGFSVEIIYSSNNQYKVAFAGTTNIGIGDTLMMLNFSIVDEPASASQHLSIVDNTITFNEDLEGNRGSGSSIRFIDLVEPTVSFPHGNYISGDQIQFTGSGGTEPYLWSVSDEAIATIDETGLLSVHQGGALVVTITDDLGATKDHHLNLFDGRLDIANHSAAAGSQYLLPIELTELPEGRDFSAFSFDFTYDTSKISFMGAVKADALTEDFSIVENALNGVKHRVVGGGTAGVNGPGDFIYLDFMLDKIAEGETTHITLNEILFNEGKPIAYAVNGSIKAAISPTTHDTTLVIDEDELYAFSGDDFPFEHPDIDRTLGSIRFLSLPEEGTLNYFSSPMTINQTVALSNLSNVTYQSNQDESGASYASFEFEVVDDANVSSNYPAEITFDVTPVNDAPSFILSESSVNVDEDFVDPIVIQLTADEVPVDEVGETITYSIDPTTLDFVDIEFDEVNLMFTISAIENGFGTEIITISADDSQSENSLFELPLSIAINSINDIPTIQDQTFTIEENLGNGTPVGTIVANDVDHTELFFTITAGNTDNAFVIDNSGVLSIGSTTAIDFETNPIFTLTVNVSDGIDNVDATITVDLTDVDEDVNQAPQITDQTFAINENSTEGTQVGTINSFDPDGDELTFSITVGNTNNAFAIDGTTGILTVANSTELDFETTPSFSLTVQVADAALNASATITINLNDLLDTNQAPEIVDQTFSIDENSANGTSVGVVVGSDPNGDALAYSITAGNTNNAFAIDEATGTLTVANVGELDFETTPSFSLTVQVADAEFNASATITINLNDVDETVNQAPQIVAQSFSVDENTANGTVVGSVSAFDPDGDALTYSITGGNMTAFSIDGSTGTLTVANANELDFETTPSFSLTIQVADAEFTSSATITINLNDLNDTNQVPQIADQAFSVDENSANGTSVGTVVASDPDRDALSYSITAGNTNNAFAIDGSTGTLMVANVAELDFETTPSFSLTVQVADAALNASATITINLNDVDESVNQSPQINAQTFSIDENSANGTLVGTVVASDPDGDALTYSITAGNTNNAFAIDGSTGALTVANVAELDFETTPTFSLTVQVADAELNASATITVDLNDIDESVNQSPQINAQTFSIDENSANGTLVGTVVASDPDGDALTYSITAGNTNNAFAIDGSTGALTVANVAELDFETTPTFSLTVQVADAELNASATITVDLNDIDESVNQSPQINAQTFSIDENSANGTLVGTVVASDPDGDALTYSITAGNTNNAFAIDGSTGALTVANVAELDFETTPTFSLTVQVADAELNASATITVDLNDIDESVNQSPQINAQTFSIDENSANGTSVGTVVASDPDGDALTYAIVGGNTNNAFLINSATGELSVGNSESLDFETISSFDLTVLVADAELNASATIAINLNDVDENTLGLIDELKSKMVFYPNPVVNVIAVEYPNELIGAYSRLTDMSGKVISEGVIDEKIDEIDMSNFNKGVYFLQLESSDISFSIKLVKK